MHVYAGAGSPEGVVTDLVRAYYVRQDGRGSTRLYYKNFGNGTNTGWITA